MVVAPRSTSHDIPWLELLRTVEHNQISFSNPYLRVPGHIKFDICTHRLITIAFYTLFTSQYLTCKFDTEVMPMTIRG